MSYRTIGMLAAGIVLAMAACEETPAPSPPIYPTDPLCGNGLMESGELCDPYAAAASWTCPDRACSAACECVDPVPEGGSGGTGGSGGAAGGGGMGGTGIGAGLPIEGDGAVDCNTSMGASGDLTLTEVVTGFDQPVLATAPAGEGSRLYVVEQRGRIILYEDGAGTVFLDIRSRVSCCGERGLLGLAFHPDYATNGRFFVHYSDDSAGGDTLVAEYARDPDDDTLALPDPVGQPLLSATQPAGNHNGGTIDISPTDGHLYIALGDGGGSNDQYGHGQNLTTVLGGIVRLDISTTPATAAGNYPGADPRLWDIGLRNPWRASFDRCTGDFYIGDVGQGAVEEIDVEPSGTGHRNYGWNTMEGSTCFNPSTGCNQTGLTLPTAEYAQTDSECSVTGGYVYRGSAMPWLRGTYFYGDFCSGRIWSFVYNGNVATQLTDRSAELDSIGNVSLSSFGQDASGELYVLDYANGTLYQLTEK